MVMRWDDLFEDLEAQGAEMHRAALDAEVADRTRRERAQVTLRSRLAVTAGAVRMALVGGVVVEGVVDDTGSDWCVIRDVSGRQWLVPFWAMLHVEGLGWSGAGEGDVGRRLRIGFALRGLARDRAPVYLHLLGEGVWSGTIDAVGADHLDFGEHPIDVPRRAVNVRTIRVVPFSAIVAVSSAGLGRSQWGSSPSSC